MGKMHYYDTDAYTEFDLGDCFQMSEYKMVLEEPVRLEVTTPDGEHRALIDVYEAWRFLEDCRKQPSEDKRWEVVRAWLAKKLDVAPDQLGESSARAFHEAIYAIGNKTQDHLKKTALSIASCQQPTQESQETSPPGPNGENELGPVTSTM